MDIFFISIRLYLFLIFSCAVFTEQIGRVQHAMLKTNTTSQSIIINGTISTDCLCQAMIINSSVIAINYFSDSKICQIFTDYGSEYQLTINLVSTVLLRQPLPHRSFAPSNLTWLLDQMSNTTEYIVASVYYPQNLCIDNKNRLVTNEWLGDLIQMDRYTLTITNRSILSSIALAALSCNTDIYYIGSGVLTLNKTNNTLRAYNSTTMNFILEISNYTTIQGPVRQCAFARNNTLMVVTAQYNLSYSHIFTYQINSPTNYTLKISAFLPVQSIYNIITVNDTLFYFIIYRPEKPIYTFTISPNGLNWTFGTFNTQGSPKPELISSIAIDPDGRIWATDEYSYIYIYDGNTGNLLNIFNKVLQSYHLIILKNYEFYISTTDNKIYRIPPRVR